MKLKRPEKGAAKRAGVNGVGFEECPCYKNQQFKKGISFQVPLDISKQLSWICGVPSRFLWIHKIPSKTPVDAFLRFDTRKIFIIKILRKGSLKQQKPHFIRPWLRCHAETVIQ